jgi:16S rRNA (uracil1498-N3)-methyltransferase
MSRRFFINGPLQPGRLRLSGAEVHHLANVLRLDAGETVTLFDGSGIEAAAEVTGRGNDAVELMVRDIRVSNTEAVVPVVLAAAVPKGDRFGWLIEKATELGVQRFVPLVTERSVVLPGEGKMVKLRRTIVEASKQCGRNRLMELDSPSPWREFVAREMTGRQCRVAHPSGQPFEWHSADAAGPLVLAVGPEGGFTEAELELALAAGARLVSLGPRVLRIETAALALAALVTVCR